MKIAILGPAHPYRGGIADTNESLARALQDQGHEVRIYTFSLQYPSFIFPGKTQYREHLGGQGLDIVRQINTINPLNWLISAGRINSWTPDLIVVRFWMPLMGPCLGSIARMVSSKTKKIALCDNVIPHEKRSGDVPFTKYFLKPFDGFATFSEAVMEELNPFTNKPKFWSHHPINDDLGEPIPKEEAREQLGLEKEGKYVLFFGLIRKYKGLHLLLEAFGNPDLKASETKLIVAGEFYDKREEYEAIIEKEGLNDSLILHDHFIPLKEIKNYFCAADLAAQPYLSASQSGVSQIAINFGTPLLVTRVGGLPEIVKDGEMGLLVDPKPEDIASKIISFFSEPGRQKYSENVLAERKNYEWSSFAKKLLEFKHSVL